MIIFIQAALANPYTVIVITFKKPAARVIA